MQMKSMRMQKASENKEVHTPPSPIQRRDPRRTNCPMLRIFFNWNWSMSRSCEGHWSAKPVGALGSVVCGDRLQRLFYAWEVLQMTLLSKKFLQQTTKKNTKTMRLVDLFQQMTQLSICFPLTGLSILFINKSTNIGPRMRRQATF